MRCINNLNEKFFSRSLKIIVKILKIMCVLCVCCVCVVCMLCVLCVFLCVCVCMYM